MTKCTLFATFLVLSLAVSQATAQPLQANDGDWPWWRGPNYNAEANSAADVCTEWSETKNVAWKAAIPGRGHSSPIVVGNRVFLATADETTQVQAVLCLDRKTGALVWRLDVNQGGFAEKIHPKNTHATSTMACDGTLLYAAFLHHDAIHLVAIDMQGTQVWHETAGNFTPKEYRNGYAASPLLYGDVVIVVGDYDGDDSFLVALDRKSGKRKWRTSRPARINYASPVAAKISGGDQILLSGCDMVAGYDPLRGKELWTAAATTMATAGTMVWDHDLVFASGGFPVAETVCIRADGSGEVVWRNSQKCYEQSMLAHDGHVYAINDGGIAFCWDAMTGKELWQERLGGPISASPVLAGQNIYATNEAGTTWVFRASPEKFELVSQNQLGTEMFASAAIGGGQIFLRVAETVGDARQESLYCIQSEKATKKPARNSRKNAPAR